MLASRLDPMVALSAAQGWGGDQYVGFTKRGSGGKECVRAAFTGDTAADTVEIAEALAQWATTLPDGAASTARSGRRVTLTACDTVGTTAPSEATLDAAVTLLVDRNDAARGFLSAGAPAGLARCRGGLARRRRDPPGPAREGQRVQRRGATAVHSGGNRRDRRLLEKLILAD